jgi:hypothetical protein
MRGFMIGSRLITADIGPYGRPILEHKALSSHDWHVVRGTLMSCRSDPASDARVTKVFGIGLSRTGTNSLHAALEILSFRAVHYPCFDRLHELIAINDAASDTPVSCVFQELDALYPGSRFILTTRETESWLESTRVFFNKPIPTEPWKREVRLRTYSTLVWDRNAFLAAYQRHVHNVMTHFDNRRDDLLVLDITAGDGWDPLCKFLQKTAPAMPFPHKNVRPAHRWTPATPSTAKDGALDERTPTRAP